MDYEKKYKEVIERASKLIVQNPYDTVSQMMEYLFPELKESEDERIRKWIIDDIRYNMNNEPLNNSEYKKEAEKAIAWLEKQGEQKFIINIDKMVDEFAHTEVKGYGIPSMIEVDAYRKGVNDTLWRLKY
jgi:hypothetical protein